MNKYSICVRALQKEAKIYQKNKDRGLKTKKLEHIIKQGYFMVIEYWEYELDDYFVKFDKDRKYYSLRNFIFGWIDPQTHKTFIPKPGQLPMEILSLLPV